MVEVFKTDINNKQLARTVIKSLSIRFPACKINIDLADCDKVLRIESSDNPDSYRDNRVLLDADQLIQVMKSHNVTIQPLTW